MWEAIMGRMPSYLVLLCTMLSFIVPLVAYKIADKLHSSGDPPWKKQPEK